MTRDEHTSYERFEQNVQSPVLFMKVGLVVRGLFRGLQ